jgi:uncharacterized RDD family membrane protein YckC
MIADQSGVQPSGRFAAAAMPRLAAFAVDGVTYLIIPALLLPVGILLLRNGVTISAFAINVVAFVLVIAPATAWAAWWEASPRGATPGKRLLRLRVVDGNSGAAASGRQSLARNVIKIAVPWELGHTVALEFSDVAAGAVPMWLWTLTAIIYGWLAVNLILLIIASHQPVHDRLAHTVLFGPKAVAKIVPHRPPSGRGRQTADSQCRFRSPY